MQQIRKRLDNEEEVDQVEQEAGSRGGNKKKA